MTGRPTDFNPDIGQEICEHIANGKSLASYCEQEDKPHFSTVYRWLEKWEDFRDEFARARETQAHHDADKLNRIQELLQAGMIQPDVARVVTDAMKWTASRRAPKAYGDKVQLSNDTNAPLIITWANGDKV